MATQRVRRLDSSHDKTFGRGAANFASGSESAAQRLRCRLKLIRGEFRLDQDAGVPWWQLADSAVRPIMGVPRDPSYVEATIKATILGTDGIESIVSFTMSFNGSTRRQSISFVVRDVDGNLVSIQDVGP